MPWTILVAAMALAGGWLLSVQDREPAGKDPSSAASCGKCHADHFREWSGRAHSQAFVDPVYQRALKERSRPESCHGCHAPVEVLAKLGKKPDARATLREEGVHCVSCHRLGDTIHGPLECATDAHRSEQDPAFLTPGVSALCASCHSMKIGPVLPVARDFQDSGHARSGKSCVTCHMPEIERPLVADPVAAGAPAKRVTHDHRVLGPGDVEFCAKAFELGLRKGERGLMVLVTNRAGHRVPGLTLRKFVVRVRVVAADGSELAAAPPLELSAENDLRVEETREIPCAFPAGTRSVEVAIDHVLSGNLVATVLQRSLKP
jgi:nitrate/TMAO reductase-like tetraheme cytochrome c subunit